MRILLFGKNGQVGWELQRSLAPIGEVVALDRAGSRGLCGDLNNLDGIRDTIATLAPEVIVNAAAYTAVDRAESEGDLAQRVNTDAVGVMAEESAQLGSLLVHYSTDYVFDGSGSQPWKESSITAPLNVYGKTKLEGEHAIRVGGCQHLIFRTSWVYSARGQNFLRTILKKAQGQDELQVITDQIGAPTGSELIADVTAHALKTAFGNPAVSGTYHLAAAGQTTWCEYARFIVKEARMAGVPMKVRSQSIKAVTSDTLATPARRPRNSRLDTGALQRTFGLLMPHWRSGVSRALEELSLRFKN